jgi:glycosyltransferase involved in cell wall biosynthesis
LINRNVNVLHILGPIMPSGMERMLASGNSKFKELGVRNAVVGRGPKHPYSEALRGLGIDVSELSSYRPWTSSGGELRKVLRESKPDIIHIHTEGDWFLTVLAIRLSSAWKTPIVRTIHSVFSPTGNKRIKRRIQALIADSQVLAFIAPSIEIVDNEKSYGRSVQYVHNWVDDSFLKLASSRPKKANHNKVAMLVGNCSEIKNHEIALEAVLATGWKIVHLGDEQNCSQREKTLLDELAKSEQLIFRGVSSPLEFMGEANLFLMPSIKEGFGIALAEALSAGVESVISDSESFRWTEGIDGVTRLPLSDQAWKRFLTEWEKPAHVRLGHWDFAPDKGVAVYYEVYLRVTSKTKFRT